MSDASVRLVHASGECEIDLARRELRVQGSPVPIGGRAFEIIEVLARSAGEVVSKTELMNSIWPGAIVTENTLHVHAMAVRKALGPYRTLLKTEPRRGYRLLGDWTARRHDSARPPVGLQRMLVDGESPVTNFPAVVTRLIGRTATVAQLRDLISAYRIVTLTGPGGIGKTSLALKAARSVVGDYADGAWLVDLAPLSEPALVPTAVAGALGLAIGPDNTTPEALARTIGDRNQLLLLDNCEHLVGAVATLAETILTLCPHVSIMTTSREILRIQGEFVFRVAPLDVPAVGQSESAEILRHSAPALFIARAKALDTDFSTDPQQLSVVATICRQLDGIPLAIEFAAARATALGLEEVAIGLRDRFALLTSGRRTALPRHRTLRATLDWSYQLLTTAERHLLQCLAIFVGPFSLDAAHAVVAGSMTMGDIAVAIADLVSKSLIFRSTDPMTVGFRLLETTRVYALDRLAESGQLADVARRHAQYLLQSLAAIEDEQQSKPRNAYLASLRGRADEVRAALDWAFSASGDRTVGLALTLAAVPMWLELSQMAVARGCVELALDHAEPGTEDEMRLLLAHGHALWYLVPGSDAMELAFARALAIAESLGAAAVQARALWGMWAVRRGRDDYASALALARRYADAAVSAADSSAMHLADRILGLTHHLLGDQPVARKFTERALREPRLLSATSGIGYQVETPIAMHTQLARILWLMGLPDQAMSAAAEALEVARRGERSFPICYAIGLAGVPVALWSGAGHEAWRQIDLLAAHCDGNQHWERWRGWFARVLRLRNGDEAAALTAAFIESRSNSVSHPPFSDVPLDAHIPVPLPEPEPVEAQWNTPEILRVDAMLMLWHAASGAVDAAEARLRRALEIARGQAALSWELRVATSLSRLLRDRGQRFAARDVLQPVYDRFTEGFQTMDLRVARSLLDEL